MSGFTPGPWEVAISNRGTPCVRTVDNSGAWICGELNNDHGENTANARLIAAAPELYGELQFIMINFRQFVLSTEEGRSLPPDVFSGACEGWAWRIERLLAKAEGRT